MHLERVLVCALCLLYCFKQLDRVSEKICLILSLGYVSFAYMYFHNLVPNTKALLLCRAALLNTGDEDAHIVPPCKPQANALSFLEAHHHSVWPEGESERVRGRGGEGKGVEDKAFIEELIMLLHQVLHTAMYPAKIEDCKASTRSSTRIYKGWPTRKEHFI